MRRADNETMTQRDCLGESRGDPGFTWELLGIAILSVSSQGGIIYLGRDWSPHLRKFKTAWLRQTFWNRFAVVFKIALRPVYEQLGVDWRKPPIQPMQLLYSTGVLLLGVLVAYLTYALINDVRLKL